MNPFLILNVGIDSDDVAIRKAYLESVKVHTSDKDSEKFSLITEAYDKINTKKKRYNYFLFSEKPEYNSPMEIIKNSVALTHMRKPMPFKEMKEFLKQCAEI